MPATAPKVVIVDCGLGNLRSIARKLERIGIASTVAATPSELAGADCLIFPGVGHFAAGMKNLRASGLDEALGRMINEERVPILGICLGMQLFSERSEEGNVEGLGWIAGETVRFLPGRIPAGGRIPHVGWAPFAVTRPSALLADVPPGQKFYFTHSYHLACRDPADVIAECDYGHPFTCAVQRGNIHGVQFHPEKSHLEGMKVLENFVRIAAARHG